MSPAAWSAWRCLALGFLLFKTSAGAGPAAASSAAEAPLTSSALLACLAAPPSLLQAGLADAAAAADARATLISGARWGHAARLLTTPRRLPHLFLANSSLARLDSHRISSRARGLISFLSLLDLWISGFSLFLSIYSGVASFLIGSAGRHRGRPR